MLRVYIETGRYAEAEATAKKFLTKTPDTAPCVTSSPKRWRSPAGTPKRSRSLNAPQLIPKSPTLDKLESDLRRAEVLDLIGQEDRAKPIYESFVKYYTDNDPETAAS